MQSEHREHLGMPVRRTKPRLKDALNRLASKLIPKVEKCLVDLKVLKIQYKQRVKVEQNEFVNLGTMKIGERSDFNVSYMIETEYHTPYRIRRWFKLFCDTKYAETRKTKVLNIRAELRRFLFIDPKTQVSTVLTWDSNKVIYTTKLDSLEDIKSSKDLKLGAMKLEQRSIVADFYKCRYGLNLLFPVQEFEYLDENYIRHMIHSRLKLELSDRKVQKDLLGVKEYFDEK